MMDAEIRDAERAGEWGKWRRLRDRASPDMLPAKVFEGKWMFGSKVFKWCSDALATWVFLLKERWFYVKSLEIWRWPTDTNYLRRLMDAHVARSWDSGIKETYHGRKLRVAHNYSIQTQTAPEMLAAIAQAGKVAAEAAEKQLLDQIFPRRTTYERLENAGVAGTLPGAPVPHPRLPGKGLGR